MAESLLMGRNSVSGICPAFVSGKLKP